MVLLLLLMCRIWKLYERRWNASFCWTVHLHFDNAKTFLCDWWSHRIHRSNGNKQENARGSMIKCSECSSSRHSHLTNTHYTSHRFSLVPIPDRKRVSLRLTWFSESSGIFIEIHLANASTKNHLHTYILRCTHTHEIHFTVHSGDRDWLPDFFSLSLGSALLCVRLSFSLFFCVLSVHLHGADAVNLQSFCHVFVI